ncbi:MAG: TIGR02391 family protein [Candidatus Bathyarchaeia archaeon]
MFESKYQKIGKAQIKLIEVEVSSFRDHALTSTLKINEMIGKRHFDEAKGHTQTISELISMYRKSIESYINQSIGTIFKTNMEFSFSLDYVQKEKDKVFAWFDEISQLIQELRRNLSSRDYEGIIRSQGLLLSEIGNDHRFPDFVNTLRSLQSEYIMYLIHEDRNELGALFNSLKFHITVRKHSEKLFKDGHYPQAIFESCKALFGQVRNKSKLTTTKDADLMDQAFGVEYSRNPLRVTKKPVLCLNNLSNLSEMNEQKGFAHLFMGILVGIRNPEAHMNIVQKDPYKTLEYLSLISLLAKRTDEAVLSE